MDLEDCLGFRWRCGAMQDFPLWTLILEVNAEKHTRLTVIYDVQEILHTIRIVAGSKPIASVKPRNFLNF